MSNQKEIKIYTLILSIFIVAVIVFFYFLDDSLEWDVEKIISCIFECIWCFFVPPTCVYFHFKQKNSDAFYASRIGYQIAINIAWFVLVAPYYGLKMYFVDLDTLKHNGGFFL